MLICWRNCP